MKILPVFVVGILLAFGTPGVASAAGIGVFQSGFTIVPKECSACPCGEAGVLQAIQNLMNLGISLGIVFLVAFLVWVGFLFVSSGANAEARGHAKHMLLNAVIGMFIVLSAWLIVDFVIKTLAGGDTQFGPWNAILQFEGDTCIQKKNLSAIQGLPGVIGVGVNDVVQGGAATGGGTGGGGAGGSSSGGGAVSSLSAQQAAQKLLGNSNISAPNSYLFRTSCNDTKTTTPNANLQQVAAGNGMNRCSCGGGGSVSADPTLLNSLVDMANAGARIQINVIAGGCHSSGSNHYKGTAADIQRTSTLDAFFAKYPKVSCQGGKTGYKVSGEVVCFEDSGHYHVSPSGS